VLDVPIEEGGCMGWMGDDRRAHVWKSWANVRLKSGGGAVVLDGTVQGLGPWRAR
jgi:hypothetical protein